MSRFPGGRSLPRARQWLVRRATRGDEGGFILLETIVVLGLITVIMTAFTTFFVTAISSTTHGRARQAATQIADSTIETIRGLPASDLVTGHNTISAIAPTTTVNNVVFSVANDLGTCIIPVTARDSSSTNCGAPPATGATYLRATVTVTWRDSTCRSIACVYTTATLLNPAGEPCFDLTPPTGITVPNSLTDPATGYPKLVWTVGEAAIRVQLGARPSGAANLSWAVTVGAMPAGLAMSPAGLISGSPTTPTPANNTVTVNVTDGCSNFASQPVVLSVVAAPTIATPANQNTQINTSVSLPLVFSCPNTPCTFTMTNGPVGLAIDNTGVISGKPTVGGTVTVTVTVTDNHGKSATTAPFTWAVLAPASVCVPTSALPNGSFEAPGNLSGAPNWQIGGSSPVLWDTTEPDNILELWGNGGNATSANGGVPITAQDGSQWAELNANQTGALYQNLATVPGQVLQWSVWHRARAVNGSTAGRDVMEVQIGSTTSQSPQVPTGQTTSRIVDDGRAWVLYTGVYTVPAGQTTTRYQFAAISTASGDNSVGNFIDNLSLNNYVACLTAPVPAQTSTVNSPVTGLQLSASRGSGSYLWGGGNTLPPGLSISAGGFISGTPTAVGTYNAVLTLTDTQSSFTQTVSLIWTVLARPTITAPANQTTTSGAAVSVQVASTCPNSPCTYTLTGAPANLAIDSSAVISGTITGAAQTYTVTVGITDAAGATTTSTGFTWTVTQPLVLTSPTTSQTVSTTSAVSVQATATGGFAPLTWSATGLPAGVTISSSGLISGTPTNGQGATYNSTITVRDSAGTTASRAITWTVLARPTITAPANQTSVSGAAVSVQVASTCPNSPCVYRLTGAPANLAIDGSAVISGTITGAAQTYTVTAGITDAGGATATTSSFTWTVTVAPLVLTSPTTTQTVSTSTAVNVQATATGGLAPLTWSATALPAGVSISSTGLISGTPTNGQGGTYNSTITVRDSAGTTTSRAIRWTVLDITNPASTQNRLTSNANYSLTATATGTTGTLTWSATSLPTGLTMSSAGVISGKTQVAGKYTSTITVNDSVGTRDTQTVVWNIDQPLTIAYPTATNGLSSPRGSAISVTPVATGGSGNYDWYAFGLPATMSINQATGVITGTAPTTVSTTTVTLAVVDTTTNLYTYISVNWSFT